MPTYLEHGKYYISTPSEFEITKDLQHFIVIYIISSFRAGTNSPRTKADLQEQPVKHVSYLIRLFPPIQWWHEWVFITETRCNR